MAEEKSKMDGFVKSIVDELRQMATTETVVGKPIKIEETTIVPVIKYSVGFGVGGGEGTGEAPPSKKGMTGKGTGYGQGGGGGIKVDPVAFITVHEGKATLLPVTKRGASIEKLVETVPDIVEKIQTINEKKE
jgi:sporulation protein YtfJ